MRVSTRIAWLVSSTTLQPGWATGGVVAVVEGVVVVGDRVVVELWPPVLELPAAGTALVAADPELAADDERDEERAPPPQPAASKPSSAAAATARPGRRRLSAPTGTRWSRARPLQG